MSQRFFVLNKLPFANLANYLYAASESEEKDVPEALFRREINSSIEHQRALLISISGPYP